MVEDIKGPVNIKHKLKSIEPLQLVAGGAHKDRSCVPNLTLTLVHLNAVQFNGAHLLSPHGKCCLEVTFFFLTALVLYQDFF